MESQKKQPQKRTGSLVVGFLLAFALFVFSGSVVEAREPARVTLVIDQHHAVYDELIDSVRRHLDRDAEAEPILSIASLSDMPASRLFTVTARLPDLIVTIGSVAAAEIAKLAQPVPVLNVLVPKASVDELAKRYKAPLGLTHSAIYLDQPLGRRLDLIRLVTPQARHIGVVLGPGNEYLDREFSVEGERRRLQILVRHVSAEGNLLATLDDVLDQSDVLLGVVDSLVFNRESARDVLITTYRHRVPLIGISPAYVKAGALAAVYSTPAQVGRQLAELLGQLQQGDRKFALPAPEYPRYFSVAVNQHVARSLDLVIDDEERLSHKLQARSRLSDE